MTSRETERVEIIQRRIKHLAGRIANYKGSDNSYDRHELSALQWALGIIMEYLNGQS